MRVRIVWLVLFLLPVAAAAGEIRDALVSSQDGYYILSIEASIDAPLATVHRLITDYDHLTEINSSIRESRILHTYTPLRHRIRSVTRVCVLFYCRRITQVQEMQQHGTSTIEAVILPELSDFRYGTALWRLTESDGRTRMQFSAELVPDFFIPTLIGTWLMRREMVNEIRQITRIIERKARAGEGQ